jgi:hypothetical protein
MSLIFTERRVRQYGTNNHGTSNGRVLSIDSIKNSQGNIFNRYVVGAGVGATSVSVRRAKSFHAALRR